MNLKHLVFVLMAVAVASSSVMAQQYLRIGTGGTAGTYYPVGVLVAKVVSQPGKIIATAQTSNGSLGNAIGVDSGSLETGFIQADVASWAHSGSGIFAGKPALSGLRLIANLYPESIHIVVRKASGVKSVLDLRGRRVALDEAGSGTLISASQVLGVYGFHTDYANAWAASADGSGTTYTNPQNGGGTTYLCNLNSKSVTADVNIAVDKITATTNTGKLTASGTRTIAAVLAYTSTSSSASAPAVR